MSQLAIYRSKHFWEKKIFRGRCGKIYFISIKNWDQSLTLGPLDLSTNPMSDNRLRNCVLISSIICKVAEDKKLSQQNCLSCPLRFTSFHSSKAFRRAMWSLNQLYIKNFNIQRQVKIIKSIITLAERSTKPGYITDLQESPAKDRFASSASSFLFIGKTNGSRYARAAAIVKAGLRHWKIEPIRSIFPIFGSKGMVQRCRPVQWKSIQIPSTADTQTERKNIYKHNTPSGVSSSLSSNAPIVFKRSMAFWTARESGGWSAFARNDPTVPSCKLLMCRHNSCKGVRRISGNWYGGIASWITFGYNRKQTPGCTRPARPRLWHILPR